MKINNLLEKMLCQPFISSERTPFFLIAKKYIKESHKILDIGAGDGAFANIIDRMDTYMLDGNAENVESLQKKYLNVKYGLIPKLPYDDKFFNMIHCSHVVEHLQPQELYDFLKECDRCLNESGYLIISAPLLWSEFYDDLSHIKPYTPKVFKRYLVWGDKSCATRPIISDGYELVEEVYRYNPIEKEKNVIYKESSILSKIITKVYKFLKRIKLKAGIRSLEISGFTIVLKKSSK